LLIKLRSQKLRELYRKSKLDLIKLLPPQQRNIKDLIKLLQEKGLSDLLPQITYGNTIEKMIKEHTSGQGILNWISENVPEDIQKDVTFCRHFVRYVLQAISNNTTLSKDVDNRFKEFVPILKLLLGTEFLQQNCLFEVQLFCLNTNFPQGLLERIFEYLYSFEIVTPSIFILWEEDEGMMEGKKEALAQTSKWLNELKEQIG